MLPVVHLTFTVVNGNHEASLGTLTRDMIIVVFFLEKDKDAKDGSGYAKGC